MTTFEQILQKPILTGDELIAFGKHKRTPIKKLPTNYIEFLLFKTSCKIEDKDLYTYLFYRWMAENHPDIEPFESFNFDQMNNLAQKDQNYVNEKELDGPSTAQQFYSDDDAVYGAGDGY